MPQSKQSAEVRDLHPLIINAQVDKYMKLWKAHGEMHARLWIKDFLNGDKEWEAAFRTALVKRVKEMRKK